MNKTEGWLMIAPFVLSVATIFIVDARQNGFWNLISKIVSFLIGLVVMLMFLYGLWILLGSYLVKI